MIESIDETKMSTFSDAEYLPSQPESFLEFIKINIE